MNVASLQLCRELHELSGWDDQRWLQDEAGKLFDANHCFTDPWSNELTLRGIDGNDMSASEAAPAYDLGYLLRKFPRWFEATGEFLGNPLGHSISYRPHLELYNDDGWVAYGKPMNNASSFGWSVADNPEDAACKLAIELFKQGVLS